MSSVFFRRGRFFDCKAGFPRPFPRVFTATPMVWNGPSKRVTYAIGEVWSTGWKRIFSMAQDETRRYFSKKHGVAQLTMKDYVRFQNWRQPFEEPQSSRSNRRSPLRHASQYSKRYGRIALWTC